MAYTLEDLKAANEAYTLAEKIPTSSFGAGWGAGLAGYKGGMGALADAIGSKLGLDTSDIAEWVKEKKAEAEFYQRNAPGATEFFGEKGVTGDGKLSDWLAYNLGQSAPYAVEALLGGVAAGGTKALVGAAGRLASEKAITEQVAKNALARGAQEIGEREAQQQAIEQLGRRYAASGGVVGASYPSAVGDILGNQREADPNAEYSLGAAMAGGVPYALLNLAGGESAALRAATGGLGRRVAGEAAEEVTDKKFLQGAKEFAGRTMRGENIGGDVLRAGAKAGVLEGASETGQEVINQIAGRMVADPSTTLTGGDALHRYAESFMAGMGLGGTVGGVSQVFAKSTDATPDAIAQRVEIARQAQEAIKEGKATPDELRAEYAAEQKKAAEEELKATREERKSRLDELTQSFKAQQEAAKAAQEEQKAQREAAQAALEQAQRNQVETDPFEQLALAAENPPEILQLGRPPRPVAPISEGPLQQVEMMSSPASLQRQLRESEQRIEDVQANLAQLPKEDWAYPIIADAAKLDIQAEQAIQADLLQRLAALGAPSGVPVEGGMGLLNRAASLLAEQRLAGEQAASATPTPRTNKPAEVPLVGQMESKLQEALRPLQEDAAWQRFATEMEAQKQAEIDAAYALRGEQSRLRDPLPSVQRSLFDDTQAEVTREEVAARGKDLSVGREPQPPLDISKIEDFVTRGLQIGAEWAQAEARGDTKALERLTEEGQAIYEQMRVGFGKTSTPDQQGSLFQFREGEDAAPIPTMEALAASGNLFKQPTKKETARGSKAPKTEQAKPAETPSEAAAPATETVTPTETQNAEQMQGAQAAEEVSPLTPQEQKHLQTWAKRRFRPEEVDRAVQLVTEFAETNPEYKIEGWRVISERADVQTKLNEEAISDIPPTDTTTAQAEESSVQRGAGTQDEVQSEVVGEGNTEPEDAAEKGKAKREVKPRGKPTPDQEIAIIDVRIADLETRQDEEYDPLRADKIELLYDRRSKLEEQAKGLRVAGEEETAPKGTTYAVYDNEEDQARTDLRGRPGARTLAEEESSDYPNNSTKYVPTETPILKVLQRGGSATDLLDAIAKNGLQTERLMARILRAIGVDKVTVDYFDREEKISETEYAVGQHYDGGIRIFRGGENARTVLHELFHAVTVSQLLRGKNFLNQSEAARTALLAQTPELAAWARAYEQLELLQKEAEAATGEKFASVVEFVAEAMSDSGIQYTLMHTQSGVGPLNPSLWQRLINTLRIAYEYAMRQLKESREISGFDNSILARVMEATAVVSDEGRKGKVLGDVVNNATTAVTPLAPTAQAHQNMQPISFSNIWDALLNEEYGLAARASLVKAKDLIKEGLAHLHTMRGLAARYPTLGVIQERISQMVRDKENILTDMNIRVRLFVNSMQDPKLREAVGQMLAGGTMQHLEMTEELAKLITEMSHGIMSGTNPIYDLNNMEGWPQLVKGIEEKYKLRLTKEDMEKGLNIPTLGKVYKPLEGLSEKQVEQAMKAYNSAMDGLIKGQLHMLHSAALRADALTKDNMADIRNWLTERKLSSITDTALEAAQKVADQYAKLSKMDVKKRKAVHLKNEKDGDLAKTFDRFHSLMPGVLSGEVLVKDEKTGELNKDWVLVRDFFGMSTAEFTKMLKPLQDAVAAQPKDKQSKTAKELANLIMRATEGAQMAESEALSVSQSLLTMYVPLRRYGKYTLRMKLYDPATGKDIDAEGATIEVGGKKQTLDATLAIIMGDDKVLMQEEHEKQNAELAASGDTVEVTLPNGTKLNAKIGWDEVQETKQYKVTINRIRPGDFINFAKAVGFEISPQARAKILKASTNADAAARTRQLQRRGTPGWTEDFLRPISDHLGSIASMVAIRRHSDFLQRTLADDEAWKWSSEAQAALEAAKVELADAKGADAKKTAQEKVDALTKAYNQMKEGERSGISGVREKARELVDFVLGQDQFEEKSTTLTKLRAATTIVQLGATIASAFTNLSSLPLHSFNYLAAYNGDKAYGGGFGASAASSAILKASGAMAPVLRRSAAKINPYADLTKDIPEEYFAKMEAKAKASGKDEGGYSAAHWEFLRKAASEGVLTAQQYNELLAQRKHSQFGPKLSKGIAHYMAIFAATEEYNRMVTGLAAFELYQKQYIGAISPDVKAGTPAYEAALAKANEEAYKRAVEAVYKTQGEYNMANRPALFRSDLGAMVFLYKTFIVTTLELISQLPMKYKAVFLGSLYMMAGAGGIPLFEELMLVMDVAAQKTGIGLGITKGNAERAFAGAMRELGDSVGIKGLDEMALRGVLDTVLGTEVFGRAGVSVGVPFAGLLKPGANFWEEVGRGALGPVGGVLEGTMKAAGKATSGNFAGALREVPFTGVKNLADAYVMVKSGNVMNKRGQVTIQNPDAQDIIARALGFYPSELKWDNDTVRREEYTKAFAKQLKAEYMVDFREAYVHKDRARMSEIKKEVQEHNKNFRGTALELMNFAESAERSGKEAAMPLRERYGKNLPKAQQQDSEI